MYYTYNMKFSIAKYLTSISTRFDQLIHFSHVFGCLYSSTALIHSYESENLAEDCKHFECA